MTLEPMAPDHPAAHSMDSAWFAVDADGHIARFDTSEDGALPHPASGAGGNMEPDFDALLLDALRVATLASAGGLPRPDEGSRPARTVAQRVVIVTEAASFEQEGVTYRDAPRRRALVEDLFDADDLVVVRESGPRVLVTKKPLDAARIASIERRRDVAGVVAQHEMYDLFDGVTSDGLFAYRHDYGGAGPGTYTRGPSPAAPLRIDEVPATIREKVARLTLPVRFAEAEQVELADFLTDDQMQTWGDTKLRPSDDPEPAPRPPAPTPPRSRAGLAWAVGVATVLGLLYLLAKR